MSNTELAIPGEEVRGELAMIDRGPLEPVAALETFQARYEIFKRFVQQQLKENLDFGTIPGSDKPCLYKPGAEKLQTLYGLVPTFEDLKVIEDFTGGLFYYRYKCKMWRGPPINGRLVAEGVGSCNSHESKYRYRNAARKCPHCNQPTVRNAAKDWDCVYWCHRKSGGCGARFMPGEADTHAVDIQPVGRINNPDIADVLNTIDKIAQKRAMIAATLIATNASEFFTQDLDDLLPPADAPPADDEDQRPADEQPNGKPRKGANGTVKPPKQQQKPRMPENKPATNTSSGPPPVLDAADNEASGELKTTGAFMRTYLDKVKAKLGHDDKSARALLGSILSRHSIAEIADTDLDWRSQLITAIDEGRFDRFKLQRGSDIKPPGQASGPPAAPVGEAMPSAEEVKDLASFHRLWKDAANRLNDWDDAKATTVLDLRLGNVQKRGKLDDTSIPWRIESIGMLRLKRIDPETGRTTAATIEKSDERNQSERK